MHGSQPKRGHKGRLIRPETPELIAAALKRFRGYCEFEPATGCVLWTGGTTMGQGHHVPYPAFWFNGDNWLGHRWAAKYIHGQDIEGFHTDHCCPNISIPNTLCVQHLQSITPRQNRELQTERRRYFIHMQVGLLRYHDVYGHDPEPEPLTDSIPFHNPPSWLGTTKGPTHDDCPF